jgi:hypothetical protein
LPKPGGRRVQIPTRDHASNIIRGVIPMPFLRLVLRSKDQSDAQT